MGQVGDVEEGSGGGGGEAMEETVDGFGEVIGGVRGP